MSEEADLPIASTLRAENSKEGQIYVRLSALMKDVKAIGKNRNNEQQNFKFRGIDDVYNAVQPLFATHGIFSTTEILCRNYRERTTANGKLMMERILTIRFRFFAEDASFVDVITDGEAMDTGDKTTNKCMAIAHKYAILQLLMIPTADMQDPDGDTPPDAKGPGSPPRQAPPKSSNGPKIPPKGSAGPKPKAELTEKDQAFLKELVKEKGWKNKEAVELVSIRFKKEKLSELTKDEFKILCTMISNMSFEAAQTEIKNGPPEATESEWEREARELGP